MSHSELFLHSTEPALEQSRQTLWRNLKRVLFALLIALLVYGVILVIVGVQLVAHLYDGQDALFEARGAALELQFSETRTDLERAHEAFSAADSRARWLLPVTFLPFVGGAVDHSRELIVSSVDIIESFGELLELGEDLLQLSGLSTEYLEDVQAGLEPSVTFDDLSSNTKKAILERFEASAGDLELLVQRMGIAEEELALLESDAFLAPVASVTRSLHTNLVQTKSYLKSLALAATILPQLSGLESEKTHLLLFLNNDEMRPGGGFIGTYGILKMLSGDIRSLETVDVYALDDAVADDVTKSAPSPLQDYNATSQWFFRDSNWSPDFATSSVWSIERFLAEVSVLSAEQQELIPSSTRIDTVIGFTPTYAASLLEIIGDVTVSGQTFTPENVAALLEYQVELGYASQGVPAEQRKEILADLVNEVKTALFRLPISQWGEVVDASSKALLNKQLALYSTDQALEDIFTSTLWGGRILPETVDVQLVVDANLASLKTDPEVQRTIAYELGRNQEGIWVGRTTIRYEHTGSFDWRTTRYRTYTRLYTPLGTELLRVQGAMNDDLLNDPSGTAGAADVFEELGLSTFGAFISIEPGSIGELVFEYVLSDEVVAAIEAEGYELTVFKQMGARDHALTLDLDFDKNVSHADPAEGSSQWGDDTYSLNTILDQDLMFRVDF
ncbi:hypothetical protein CO174_03160 [Candidatus Uhrbacteria bacterium CG_4_9_14_3_um_filter_50_9]|uniref:DUF4012 domain-containing protein n=1 Tax=Candidatus Uhrbacteria bacterium CG_4_9_14_3_um_filter_50_9 TaxID=1975035 RepID=A0A2M7XC59_9BACT|nr:MAG: hypothetical protein CO174_03160 [Candidatus Uhrbacteria bacterium CG_4_9_14_3_um_filter_50_9]